MEGQHGNMYLAVDIGGTAVKTGLVDEKGNFLRTAEYSVDFDGYETPILNTVIKSCGEFLQETGVRSGALSAVGVSATGSINTVKGTVDGSAGRIKNWKGSRIKDEMERRFQVPAYVLNDANAAALGEVWLGAARNKRNVVAITIGTGVGGGIIINSQLLLGANGFAGEIGHVTFLYGGRTCPCGNIGCLEEYASMTALVKSVRQEIEAGRIKGISPEEVNGRVIFQEIERGNREIAELADEWMDCIAAGIRNYVHIFNPEMVVIGGGVSSQKELFIDKVRQKALDKMHPEFIPGLEIAAAKLANQAGMAGAVYYCIQREREEASCGRLCRYV